LPIHSNSLFFIEVLYQRAILYQRVGRINGKKAASGIGARVQSNSRASGERQSVHCFVKTTNIKSLINAISGLPKKNSAEKLTMPNTTTIKTRMKKMVPTTFDIRFPPCLKAS
jgi:hypothetical protein